MAIDNRHPRYGELAGKWSLGRASYEGEDAIKAGGAAYLPPTSGQIQNGYPVANTLGANEYAAYKLRAFYPDLPKDAVEAAIGIMHREEPTIELPAAMQDMRENCTLLGESLEMLLRKINSRQLMTGRLGILGDIRDDGGTARPVLVLYNELAIINWDDTSNEDDDVDVRLVVLDESGYEMDEDLSWEMRERYRVLSLVDPDGNLAPTGVYGTVLLDKDQSLGAIPFENPNIMGQTLNEIPFVFVNSKDLSPTPDEPPLHGLANLCLAIYRGEADYRQNLFMQGQDTLVRIGAQGDEDENVRVGAGSRIDVPLGGDAKYIGVSSNGLPEQRQCLENDYKRATQKSGQLLDATSRAKESGDALRIRVAAQTATLPQIAKAGAAGLEKVLKALATWMGADPAEVRVEPNLQFTGADLNGKTLIELIQAKTLGAPLSEESVHEYMQEQGFTNFTLEEELALIEAEIPRGGGVLTSPVDEPDEEENDARNSQPENL